MTKPINWSKEVPALIPHFADYESAVETILAAVPDDADYFRIVGTMCPRMDELLNRQNEAHNAVMMSILVAKIIEARRAAKL